MRDTPATDAPLQDTPSPGGSSHQRMVGHRELEARVECTETSGLVGVGGVLTLEGDEDAGKQATRGAMGSSEDMTWPTPQYAFDALNMEFGFTLDPCCWPATAKCAKYYTPKENGLVQDWSDERVFMNPPYGREIGGWMRKALAESRRGALVVCLVPARVDTEWWHESATRGEVRFLKGRLKNANGQGWPFPVAIVVFRPHAYRVTYDDLFRVGGGGAEHGDEHRGTKSAAQVPNNRLDESHEKQ